jgi:hypothetical protein
MDLVWLFILGLPFSERKKNFPRNTEETEILIHSVRILSVPRSVKCSEFRSEPFRRREKHSKFQSEPLSGRKSFGTCDGVWMMLFLSMTVKKFFVSMLSVLSNQTFSRNSFRSFPNLGMGYFAEFFLRNFYCNSSM